MTGRNGPSWSRLGLDELIRSRPASTADELRRKANAARRADADGCGNPRCDVPWHWPASTRARIVGMAWFWCPTCYRVFVVGPAATTDVRDEAAAAHAHYATCPTDTSGDHE